MGGLHGNRSRELDEERAGQSTHRPSRWRGPKAKMLEQEGITVTSLFFGGEQLQDHRSLDYHQIPKGSLLHEAPE